MSLISLWNCSCSRSCKFKSLIIFLSSLILFLFEFSSSRNLSITSSIYLLRFSILVISSSAIWRSAYSPCCWESWFLRSLILLLKFSTSLLFSFFSWISLLMSLSISVFLAWSPVIYSSIVLMSASSWVLFLFLKTRSSKMYLELLKFLSSNPKLINVWTESSKAFATTPTCSSETAKFSWDSYSKTSINSSLVWLSWILYDPMKLLIRLWSCCRSGTM